MIVGIDARKSTERNVVEEANSVTRQIENARTFAASKDWTVDHAHVFVDDGISGAEFEKRPGLQTADAHADTTIAVQRAHCQRTKEHRP